jgi:hypothetical protein
MRPARSVNAELDSLNAFILRFAGVWRFFLFRLRAGLSIVNPPCGNSAGQMKDQCMLKSSRFMPVLAGLFIYCAVNAATLTQNFSADPQQGGWKVFGNSEQFYWNSTHHNLEVTWDSAQSNSFFYHALGTTLSRRDDFSIEFDLLLKDVASGTEPLKTGGMEIGIGLLNLESATSTNFMRGVFGSAPNLAEFDYFPPGYYDYGGMIYDVAATTTTTLISTNSFAYAPTVFAPYEFELPTNLAVHVSMNYTATNQTMVTRLTTNGSVFIELPSVVLTDATTSAFTDSDDFRLDAFAISSYSSTGDDYDSVLAHGIVGNISISFPLPVENFSGSLSNGSWQGQFTSRSNWVYNLQRTADFQTWSNVSPTVLGDSTNGVLQDTNPPAAKAFYRVRAVLP